jgi:hypothetical protein
MALKKLAPVTSVFTKAVLGNKAYGEGRGGEHFAKPMRKSHQPLTTCVALQKTTKLSRTLHPRCESKVNPANTVAQTVPSETDPIIREPAGMNIPYTCPSLLHKSFMALGSPSGPRPRL